MTIKTFVWKLTDYHGLHTFPDMMFIDVMFPTTIHKITEVSKVLSSSNTSPVSHKSSG